MSRERFLRAGAVACALALLAATAHAAPGDAAALFDEGVRKFKRAEYEAAAAAFLRADEIAPSNDALVNAIAAGRRGHAHLLVAQAAQRALGRADADQDLSRLAREALAEAAAQLARIELSCAPQGPVKSGAAATECALTIDEAKAAPGVHYVLPGTRRFAAAIPSGTRDEQPLICNAGATYTVVLHPAVQQPKPPPSASASASASAAPAATGWPPAVVYAGAGVTAVLAGLSVWSGLDAVAAKDALPDVPLRAQNDDVHARATRTNALIVSSAVVGAATAAAAIWLVSWQKPAGPKAAIGISSSPAGATVTVRGRF